MTRRPMLAAAALLAIAAPSIAVAQAADPAAARVGTFYATLLQTMKAGRSIGQAGRVQRLTPAVQQAFNLPYMTFLAVGSSWNQMSAADKASVQAAFQRYTVASYAHNFDTFSGEKLVVDPKVLTRGQDKVVATQIVSSDGAPANLNYRMREAGGSWKIIDVSYNNISQLTTERSDFASSLRTGGASALVSKLDSLTMKLK